LASRAKIARRQLLVALKRRKSSRLRAAKMISQKCVSLFLLVSERIQMLSTRTSS